MNNRVALQRVLSAAVPKGWTALPGLNYQIHTPGGEEFMKIFLSTMLQLFGVGIARVLAREISDVELVMLMRLTEEEGHLAISCYAPFPELLAFVRAHLPPTVPVEKMQQTIDALGYKMQRRCAVPLGTWVPVAVVCHPSQRSILMSNVNQFENGDQFLTPAACVTTSGFLNFLGTTMIRIARAPEDFRLQVSDVDQLLGKGLDPWIRWVHHAVATGNIFDSNRILVNPARPESYDFLYDS